MPSRGGGRGRAGRGGGMDWGTGGFEAAVRFSHVFPEVRIKLKEECPECGTAMADVDIRAGWSGNMNDYTTRCPNCSEKFVPRFALMESGERVKSPSKRRRMLHFTAAAAAETTTTASAAKKKKKKKKKKKAVLHCEYLSPLVLKKEMQGVIEGKGVKYIQSSKFRSKSKTLFWNLLWHFVDHRLPVFFLLPAQELRAHDDDEDDTDAEKQPPTRTATTGKQQAAAATAAAADAPTAAPAAHETKRRSSSSSSSATTTTSSSSSRSGGLRINVVPPSRGMRTVSQSPTRPPPISEEKAGGAEGGGYREGGGTQDDNSIRPTVSRQRSHSQDEPENTPDEDGLHSLGDHLCHSDNEEGDDGRSASPRQQPPPVESNSQAQRQQSEAGHRQTSSPAKTTSGRELVHRRKKSSKISISFIAK